MTRRVWVLACAVLAAWLTGCGNGSGGSASSADATDVRTVLSALLVAGAKGEEAMASVADKLDAKEFATSISQAPASVGWDKLPQAERDSAARGCFNQLLVVSRETVLKDTASIDAALAAGKYTILPQTRTANVEFQGALAEGKGPPVRFKAKLSKGADNFWRLVTFEPQYGY